MTNREKIVKLARTLKAICRHPVRFAEFSVAFGDSAMREYVGRTHGLPRGLPTLDLLDLCPGFDEQVAPYAFLEGGSTPIDLALLRALARRYEPCRYFEFGAWRGESAANVAAIAAECISLSWSDAEIRQAGWDERYVAIARYFSRSLKNVVHLGHDSRTFDFAPYFGTCDLVFIDGDHSYDGVRSDTAHAFRLLRDDRSVIVWHDYMRTPESEVQWGVVAGLLDGAPPEARRHVYHVSNTLCAVYVQGEFRAAPAAAPAVPDKAFEVRIAVRRC
ncbi:MAG TPA: class I SAM-dependent methyltransferase [Vicinamibacterales bacterium]|nr:class I SAM-dependent methyltransferase [Vicinamibacterales bacterium]